MPREPEGRGRIVRGGSGGVLLQHVIENGRGIKENYFYTVVETTLTQDSKPWARRKCYVHAVCLFFKPCSAVMIMRVLRVHHRYPEYNPVLKHLRVKRVSRVESGGFFHPFYVAC